MAQDDNGRLVALLRGAQQIVVFSGAGISTGSGIPDFRGPGGVWSRRRPVYYEDFMNSDEARVEHWDYKLESWEAFRDARPKAVHHAVVDLERAQKLRRIVTQNIDGLHQKAGASAELIVELHGTNTQIECQSCQQRFDPQPHFDAFARTRRPPLCRCGGFLKPATISFGQSLRTQDLESAAEAARGADLVVALGSSLSVQPAASMPLIAAECGVPYVIVNRGPTDHDVLPAVTLRLEGDVVEVFPPAVAGALRG